MDRCYNNSISTKLNHVHYGNGQWIAGVAGTVIRSSDQGLTWSVVSFGATFDLNKLVMQIVFGSHRHGRNGIEFY